MYIHIYIYTYIHIYIYTYIHIYIYTYIHICIYVCSCRSILHPRSDQGAHHFCRMVMPRMFRVIVNFGKRPLDVVFVLRRPGTSRDSDCPAGLRGIAVASCSSPAPYHISIFLSLSLYIYIYTYTYIYIYIYTLYIYIYMYIYMYAYRETERERERERYMCSCAQDFDECMRLEDRALVTRRPVPSL